MRGRNENNSEPLIHNHIGQVCEVIELAFGMAGKGKGKEKVVTTPASASTSSSRTTTSTVTESRFRSLVRDTNVNQLLVEQAQLRAQVTDVSKRVSRIEIRPPGTVSPASDRARSPVREDRPSDDARVTTSSGDVSTSANDPMTLPFRSRTTSDERNRIACALGLHGMRLNEVLGAPDVDFSLGQTPGRDGTPTSIPASRPLTTSTPIPATAPAPLPLTCKHELLGSFDGDPLRLETFLSRVRDITRSFRVDGWENAVVAAVPQALKGDAEIWHGGLSDEQIHAMRTVADIAKAMRAAFPANRAQQRKEARERSWNAKTESAMSYYFAKIQLMRQAFGQTYDEESLAQDVADGLEASMRAYIRLPTHHPTLDQLQSAIAEWEPTWREVQRVPLASKTGGGDKVAAGTAGPTTTTGSAPPARPPRSEQRNSPAVAQSSVSAPVPSQPSFGSLASTYDPARVVPASGDQPRMYRRPDSTKVMRLARNCGKCGGSHFDFEHEHLLKSGQIHTLDSLTEDYPEVDEAELGLAPF
ncbi:hypothetical protein A4X13_0g7405 [Tilletia indica]|uniref:Retrotransposon gag domain-containing protein n=1 Tax=Tilletia indica TaxID=43049 RepID=A0A8T8SJA4_9BASI|nr:hypothetical protein A4X13_0g7405 [Tilletia indica]